MYLLGHFLVKCFAQECRSLDYRFDPFDVIVYDHGLSAGLDDQPDELAQLAYLLLELAGPLHDAVSNVGSDC